MPVQAIIPPDATIAGGVVVAGRTFTVTHNQLSGNAAKKLARITDGLQEYLDRRENVDDLPLDDPDHPDHVDNAALGYNTYNDPSGIAESVFYWRENPNRLWRIIRTIFVTVTLTQANDPTIGGNDRYSLGLERLG